MIKNQTQQYIIWAPTTPGAQMTRQATSHNLAHARQIAHTLSRRKDLRRIDVEIRNQDDVLIEYAGPCKTV